MRPPPPSGGLALAIGNDLRGDDGVGPAVGERLRASLPEGSRVRVIVAHQLLPEHAFELAGAERALFIDATVDLGAGELSLESLSPEEPAPSLGGHVSTPAGLLWLAARLYGHSPPAQVLRIGAGELGLVEGLSAPVAAALEPAVELARAALVPGGVVPAPAGGGSQAPGD